MHPGIKGDRGPSSLDWAIANQEKSWGVTILEAADEFDAGPIWASHEFALKADPPAKSSLYRDQVTDAAVRGVLEAVARIETGGYRSGAWQPEKLHDVAPYVRGRLRPPMRQADRAIDWRRDKTAMIVRRIRAADSAPGVLGTLLGKSCFLYGAHEEERLQGAPGQVLARRDGAICIGTIDGAVWISHLKAKDEAEAQEVTCRLAQAGIGCELCDAELCQVAGIKLPATQVLGPLLRGVPEAHLPIDAPADHRSFREIVYTEEDEVGYLSFDFYNGAMSTSQCTRLRDAFLHARRARPGSSCCWVARFLVERYPSQYDRGERQSGHGILAEHQCDRRSHLRDPQHHVPSRHRRVARQRRAGGAMLALAADHIYARSGVVLNPHYRSMGDLYGSEYWTYTLPRLVGADARAGTDPIVPANRHAGGAEIGFLDDAFGEDAGSFMAELRERARRLARQPEFRVMLRRKHERRLDDESVKPLASYRAEELARMWVNFFGPDPAYHEARRRFVFKGNPPPQGSQAPIETAAEAGPWVLSQEAALASMGVISVF